MAALPWRPVADGVELAVRLTPRCSTARIEGITEADGKACLKLRVAAPPVEGAANAALIDFLARALRIPHGDITVVTGARGRVKRLRLRGEDLPHRLAGLLAEARG